MRLACTNRDLSQTKRGEKGGGDESHIGCKNRKVGEMMVVSEVGGDRKRRFR